MSEVVELVPANFSQAEDRRPPERFTPVGSVVQTDGGPSFQNISVLMHPNHEVRPGEFLGVWHGRRGNDDLLTVLQVEDCIEVNPNETAVLAHTRRALDLGPAIAHEATSTRVFRVAKCKTVEDLRIDGTIGADAASAPEMLCRAADPVVRLPDDLVTAALGGLDHPDKGLSLGTLLGTTSPITLSPDILQLHIGVFGNPGKGKSYASGTIIEEMAQWDVPGIILDVNGEMVEAVKALGGEVISLPDTSRFGLALHNITGRELMSIAPQVDPKTLYAELIEISHDAVRGRVKPGESMTLDDVIAEADIQGSRSGSKSVTINAAKAKVGSLKSNPLIGEAFPFVEELAEKRLICLDCRRLQLPQTRLVAAAAAREIQNYGRRCARLTEEGKATPDEASWLAVLFVDEAHTVVPEAENSVSTNVLRELARMGRHSRTGLILASQSPADLDASILKRMQTRFIFALERDQLKSIGGVRSDLGDELVDGLPKLGRGICAVSGNGDQIRHGFLMRVRERRTPVGGGTPPVFATRTKKRLAEA
ncbi:MAG TPA: ATP-binding protein [Allosphingosinicella sp.]